MSGLIDTVYTIVLEDPFKFELCYYRDGVCVEDEEIPYIGSHLNNDSNIRVLGRIVSDPKNKYYDEMFMESHEDLVNRMLRVCAEWCDWGCLPCWN